MASVKFEGFDEYEKMLAKLGDSTDGVLKEVVAAGLRILRAKVKSANATFARYVKTKAARKNQYGWFAQVQFRGKTSEALSGSHAVFIYEHGRAAGEKNGHKYPAQPARPWLNAACAAVEPECIAEMQRVYDEEAEKIANP
jgi:Cu/Zn superoxide dismutase